MTAVTVFEFSGGELCLDFANTWGNRPDPAGDRLGRYQDLAAWAVQSGTLRDSEAAELTAVATRDPGSAERVLRESLQVREAVYRAFAAIAAGGSPEQDDLERLNDVLSRAFSSLRLDARDGCCAWVWSAPSGSLERPLWPIVRSAAELLTSRAVDRVRECASEDCAWLFLDTSRNRSRKWCDMASCGNRAKARRYYRRHHRS